MIAQTATAKPTATLCPNSPTFGNGQSVYKRNLLRDALHVEQVTVEAIHDKTTKRNDLANLIRAFCALIPVIRALQGKTLVLSATLAVDRDPAHVMKRLKQLQKRKGLIDISGSPFAQFSESPPIDAIETPKQEKKTTTSE